MGLLLTLDLAVWPPIDTPWRTNLRGGHYASDQIDRPNFGYFGSPPLMKLRSDLLIARDSAWCTRPVVARTDRARVTCRTPPPLMPLRAVHGGQWRCNERLRLSP